MIARAASRNNRKALKDSSNVKRKQTVESSKVQRASKRQATSDSDSSNDKRPSAACRNTIQTNVSDETSSIETHKKPSTTKISWDAVKIAMDSTKRTELTKLIERISRDCPEARRVMFVNHRPDNEPVRPLDDDPLLKRCFHCLRDGSQHELRDWFGIMACNQCHRDKFNKPETCQWFGFSDHRANRLERTKFYYNSRYQYCYEAETIAKAIKSRDGSMYEWLVSKHGHIFSRPRPTTLEKLEQAPTEDEKDIVLNRDLWYTSEEELENLVFRAFHGRNCELTVKGGIFHEFLPPWIQRPLYDQKGSVVVRNDLNSQWLELEVAEDKEE